MLIGQSYLLFVKTGPVVRKSEMAANRQLLRNACVTFTQAILKRNENHRCSAEGSSCYILSLYPVCVCQEGAEIDRAVQSSVGPWDLSKPQVLFLFMIHPSYYFQ